jgi:hypothetical protein
VDEVDEEDAEYAPIRHFIESPVFLGVPFPPVDATDGAEAI